LFEIEVDGDVGGGFDEVKDVGARSISAEGCEGEEGGS
jgi:hypothetical protein